MKHITAIDLGTTKVVGLVGEKTPYGCRVIAFSERPSQGVMRGEVVNIQNVLNAVTPCIEELRQKTGEKIDQVYVGIAGQHIRSQVESNVITREQVTEEISEEEIRRLEQNMYKSRLEPGEEILHVIPQCYHVDDFMEITDPVGMLGKKIEANFRLFIGRTISAEHTKRCIERAGLRLEQLILEPLASAKAVLTDEEKELGVAMVDIGGGTTDLLVYHNNVVRHAAVIPFGGNVITEDIRQGCGIAQRLAEQMKIQFGYCYSDLAPANKTIIMPGIGGREPREISFKTLANIIEARVSEIMDAVIYEIQNSGYADRLQAGMVLTGGGALLTHLPQYVSYKTGLDARVAQPLLDPDSAPELKHGAYSCAVGLLLKGIEHQEAKKPAVLVPEWEEVFKPEPMEKKSEKKTKEPKIKTPKIKEPKPSILERVVGGLFTDFHNDHA